MFARNSWNGEFANRVVSADLGGFQTSWTGDRLEFLGRNASLDPCAALQALVTLSDDGREHQVQVVLR